MCTQKKHFRIFVDKLGNWRDYYVPCGQCLECKKALCREWSIRLQEEFKVTKMGLFITLTYRDDELHYLENSDYPTLWYRDFQLFMKRLRKQMVKLHFIGTIRYFCVGEYGAEKGRPHYHVILFGIPASMSYVVRKCWKLGWIYIGYRFDERCCNYVSKYVFKNGLNKLDYNSWSSPINCDSRDVFREFRHMSQGLGKNYLTPNNVKYHMNVVSIRPESSDYAAILTDDGVKFSCPIQYIKQKIVKDGREKIIKVPLPRYYKKKIFIENEENYLSYANYFYRVSLCNRDNELNAILTNCDFCTVPQMVEDTYRRRKSYILSVYNTLPTKRSVVLSQFIDIGDIDCSTLSRKQRIAVRGTFINS